MNEGFLFNMGGVSMINIDDILLNVLNVLRVLFIDRMGLYVVGVGLDN